jgi:hypothetical protein
MQITTVQDFYSRMQQSTHVRRRLTAAVLHGEEPIHGDIDFLRSLHGSLKALTGADGRVLLEADGRGVSFPLDYEIDELEKDLLYLEQGEEALLARMAELHPGFREELEDVLEFFRATSFPLGCLLTDRDGTVNNYCGRYLSSIQSVYNAVFLSRFAAGAVGRAVILTSAPLSGGGLEDLTVSPPGTFILAGSKGREYLDDQGRRGALAIEADKQRRLDRLNQRLTELLAEPEYEIHGLIGSGLQFKFGQTTVARQDIYGSIPLEKSQAFARKIDALIGEVDPEGRYFRSEDTGKDIEIILTVEGKSGLKDFDKGDGIRFLDGELSLQLHRGGNLICGDTPSDVPMIAAAAEAAAAEAEAAPDPRTIFVTREEELKEAVRRHSQRAHFVSTPDVLVCLLNQLGKERR